MANSNEMCNSFKTELLLGLHALGTCTETRTISNKDALKAALYYASATLNKGTTAYSGTGEITGTNYTTTGEVITNNDEPILSTDTANWTPSASIVYTNITEATAFDAVLIYNDQFATKRAISVHTFGSQTVTAGNFTLTMPSPGAATGLIRLA